MTALLEPTDEFGQETKQAMFHITDDASACWLLRRIANIEAEKARITAQAAEMVRQLDSDSQRLRYLYESELLDYCRRKLADSGNRRRSVTFLQGTVAFRSVPATVKVSDPVAALVYAQANGLPAVKTVVTLDAAAYRAAADAHRRETGELLPGLDTTPAYKSAKITFGKPID